MAGIEALAPVAAVSATLPGEFSAAAQLTTAGAPGGFANLLLREISGMNADVGAAEAAMRDLASGQPVELHTVMVDLEQARLSVQTFLQIRNKLIESFQDVMRMQM